MLRTTISLCLLGVSFLISACSSSPPANSGNQDGMTGGDGGTTGGSGSGYLHTRGSQIVDSSDAVVRLTGLSWFGMETDYYAPHGLDKQSLTWMLDRIAQLGYNTIRIPFSTQMLDSGRQPNHIDFTKNPDLQGKKPLELLDKIVELAGARQLRIILDRHRPDAYSQSELWFTGSYSEQRWIDDWKMLAQHYLGNPTVVGFDLHNEPHGQATWGSGNMGTAEVSTTAVIRGDDR